jgi:hypothetical protein
MLETRTRLRDTSDKSLVENYDKTALKYLKRENIK